MDKASTGKTKKYLPLCRELLKLKNINDPEPGILEAFIGDETVSGHLDYMSGYLMTLWDKQTLKNRGHEAQQQSDIKTLDRNDRRLTRQNREFSSLQELLNVDTSPLSSGKKPDPGSAQTPDRNTIIEPESGITSKPEPAPEVISGTTAEPVSDTITKPQPITTDEGSKTAKPEPNQVEKEKTPMPIPLNINRDDPVKTEKYDPADPEKKPKKSHYSSFDFRLPNATVGKPYSSGFTVTFQGSAINLQDIEILDIKGLESTGLDFESTVAGQEKTIAEHGKTASKDNKAATVIKDTVIKGEPSKSGEIEIDIFFRLKNSEKGHKAKSVFVINPDPRSLWKDIPSDKSSLFWKPDEDRLEIEAEDGWKMVGASKRGRSHAHEGKCRDDHFLISFLSSKKWHILAVADGAGSAALSREGSRIAVTESARVLAEKLEVFDSEIVDILTTMSASECVIENRSVTVNETSTVDEGREDNRGSSLVNRLKETLYKVFSLAVYEPVKVIHETVKQIAKQQNDPLTNPLLSNELMSKNINPQSNQSKVKFRDFHTTLILAAHKEIDGRHFVASYWIGDGGIGLYNEGDSIKILGEGDSGEFAGQTRFLDNNAITSEDIYRRICFEYQKSMTALVLMSDGITDPVFETDQKLGTLAVWDRVWKENISKMLTDKTDQTGANLLEWLDFWSQGNHDDRTVALLYRQEKKEPL
ncbi:MAG: protein phosphatase 2C domain-containing protein [Desulfamplus sp.]|nr:protein phosphatase 2C domain-containing protein [Desulfamplus sp.]